MNYPPDMSDLNRPIFLCEECGSMIMPGELCKKCQAGIQEQLKIEAIWMGMLCLLIGYLLTLCGVWNEEVIQRGVFFLLAATCLTRK